MNVICVCVCAVGVGGIQLFCKTNAHWLWGSYYENKTVNGAPVILSLVEEQYVKTIQYRVDTSQTAAFAFFPANSLDNVAFGQNCLGSGAHIGLAPSSLADNSRAKLTSMLATNGGFVVNVLGERVSLDKLKKRLDADADGSSPRLDAFYDTLLLSDEARLFGIVHAIAQTDHLLKSFLPTIVDVVAVCAAYMYTYTTNRAYKRTFRQRRLVYVQLAAALLVVSTWARLYSRKACERADDRQACAVGLDACEGSLEYYDKMLARNKLLRDVLDDGPELIDADGNYRRQVVRIPLTELSFRVPYNGLALTKRRDECRAHLVARVRDYTTSGELEKRLEAQQQQQRAEDGGDAENASSKEWPVFRNLRNRMEELLHSKKK